jgi:hypothetical protein
VLFALQRQNFAWFFFALIFVDLAVVSASQLWRTGFPRTVAPSWAWLLVVSVLVFGLLTHFAVIREGQQDADTAKQGLTTGSPLLGLHTELVTVHPKAGFPRGIDRGDCYLLLGSDKTLVLYKISHVNCLIRNQRSLRVPADSVSLVGAPFVKASKCRKRASTHRVRHCRLTPLTLYRIVAASSKPPLSQARKMTPSIPAPCQRLARHLVARGHL